jgi:hypothetical protein
MQTICLTELTFAKHVISSTQPYKRKPAILFYVYNGDGMYVARYHNEAMALTLALRIGGCVSRETVLL